jgi:hypothetical protein
MKKITIPLIYVLLISCSACSTNKVQQYYLSPNGNDNNPGSFEQPFLTLEKARNVIRGINKQSKYGITIYLRGGVYSLDKTFVLEPVDSGSKEAPIKYVAYPGETPILSGGKVIENWQALTETYPEIAENAKGEIQVAQVPKGWKFHFLYIDGKPVQRSRSINDDLWRSWPKDYTFGEPEKEGQLMTFDKPAVLKNLPTNGDLEMMVIIRQYGVIGNGIVTNVNVDKGTARWNSTQLNLRSSRNPSEKAYRFENALALIDEPGEWAVNSERGEVYYWSVDKDLKNAEIIAPHLHELIRFQGDEENEKWVHDIEISGLTLKYTDRLPEDKWPHQWLKRQWENPDAMVFIQGTHDCTLKGNTLLYSGTYGMALDHYAQNILVEGNEIAYTGSGGIQMYGYGPGTKDVNHNNTIQRNYIHDHGLANYWHSPSIQILGSGSNRIAYNFFERSAYSTISMVGINPLTLNTYAPKGSFAGQVDDWNHGNIRWEDFPKEMLEKVKNGEKPFTNDNFFDYMHSDSNIVEYNICNEPHAKLFEGGAIYAWHPGKGNVVNNNLIYKSSPMHGSSVIALDDRAEYFHIEGNVIWVNGVILDVIGMRNYTREVTMIGNIRVAWKPEHEERRKRPADWFSVTKGIQPFIDLYREIRIEVEKQGGWIGKPILEVLDDDSSFPENEHKDIDTSTIIPVIGEGK